MTQLGVEHRFAWVAFCVRLLASLCLVCESVETPETAESEADVRRCLEAVPLQSRADFPEVLNCLGLVGEAVEVGVQAGVHASSFLERWQGRHLRLVDKWGVGDAEADDPASQLFYVDIANIHGMEIRSQHRVHCEARLAEALRTGRAEIFNLDSAVAAAMLPDSSLDFVYLDARHDFAGVVDDIQAWWPKVKVGGVFAGHDFVDGEFPEGDFFWRSALQEVLPGVARSVHVTQEKNRYPSFFLVKTEALASLTLQKSFVAEALARRFYAERSKYFALWQSFAQRGDQAQAFLSACGEACGKDCSERALQFTPTRSAASTLRPFACRGSNADAAGSAQQASKGGDAGAVDSCASEMVVDVKAYNDVCLERCSVTCIQRSDLFAQFGTEILSI